jgi:hypothetical protein
MIGHTAPTRLVADDVWDATEYTAKVEFEGWEYEDDSQTSGWDVTVFDDYRGIYITLRLSMGPDELPEVQTLLRYSTGS